MSLILWTKADFVNKSVSATWASKTICVVTPGHPTSSLHCRPSDVPTCLTNLRKSMSSASPPQLIVSDLVFIATVCLSWRVCGRIVSVCHSAVVYIFCLWVDLGTFVSQFIWRAAVENWTRNLILNLEFSIFIVLLSHMHTNARVRDTMYIHIFNLFLYFFSLICVAKMRLNWSDFVLTNCQKCHRKKKDFFFCGENKKTRNEDRKMGFYDVIQQIFSCVYSFSLPLSLLIRGIGKLEKKQESHVFFFSALRAPDDTSSSQTYWDVDVMLTSIFFIKFVTLFSNVTLRFLSEL